VCVCVCVCVCGCVSVCARVRASVRVTHRMSDTRKSLAIFFLIGVSANVSDSFMISTTSLACSEWSSANLQIGKAGFECILHHPEVKASSSVRVQHGSK
jgi:hypothetical protein